MNNNPLVNSANSSAKTSGLKPALATVLASLEVQLDQELARYRRTRIGSRVPNQPRLQNIITNQPQDVTDTKSIETDVQFLCIFAYCLIVILHWNVNLGIWNQ